MVRRQHTLPKHRTAVIKALKDWFWWQSASLAVVLYAAARVSEGIVLGRRWHDFDMLDVAQLIVLALVVGTTTWYVRWRVQQHLAAVERGRRRLELLTAENAAVNRAVGAAVRELAQPLSGVLSYSELLLSADQGSGPARQEVEGLREGALRLEQLVHTLRQTVDSAAYCDAEYHIRLADAVEQSVTAPRPRLLVRRKHQT